MNILVYFLHPQIHLGQPEQILSSDRKCKGLCGHPWACLLFCDHVDLSAENLHDNAPTTHVPGAYFKWTLKKSNRNEDSVCVCNRVTSRCTEEVLQVRSHPCLN